ncbi:MAG: hypothetical protein ABR969_05850 [Sedimentisphaerales bacterium]|jgi:hypothetical protein
MEKIKTCQMSFVILLSLLLVCGCEEKKQIKTAKQPPVLKQKAVKANQKSTKSSGKAGRVKQKSAEDMNSPSNCARVAAENKQLKEKLETLMGIDKPARIEALSTITAIEITSRSGLYDKNKDKKNDTLIVYLKPIDDMGDVIKAAGAVDVELWNLNAKPQEALLKSWVIEPKELKKNWSGSLMTCYYKLQFDVNSVLTGKEKDLTLKAQFTDYLTGKVLKGQKVINSK